MVLARITIPITLPAPEEQEILCLRNCRALHRTKDTACVDSCPVDCIHPKKDSDKFGPRDALHRPVECIDCALASGLPSRHLRARRLPEKWKEYTERMRSIRR